MRHLLLFVSICITLTSQAQWTSDTTLNTTVRDSAGAMSPMIATRSDGSNYISWFENGSQGLELRLQLLDSNGYEQWTHGGIVVSNYPQTTSTSRYDLKTDNVGNAIVAFQDTRTAGALNIVVHKVSASANLLWGLTGVQLIDPTSEEGLAPVIGIAFNNNIYVAWNADSASKKWVACQYISSNGTIQWNQPYRVKDLVGSLKYSRPKLFSIGTSIQMLYVEEVGNFPTAVSTLYTQRFDSLGANHFPSAIQVSTKTIPYYFFPEVHPDDNGGFFVAFNSSNPTVGGLNDVYAQYIDYNGNLWSPTGIEAANSTTEHKTTPSACYITSSNEFFVLIQVQNSGQTMSGLTVQRFDGSGNVMLGANGTNLFPIAIDYYLPYTISDALNGVIVSCGYGPNGQVHLLAEKIDYNGTVLWPGVVSPLCAANSNKDDVQAGTFVNNNLVFVWQDTRNGSGVFAQNINGDGLSGITNSIDETSPENKFSLYPNPSDHFTLKFNDNSEKQIRITDMSGRVVFSEIISSNENLYSPDVDVVDGIYLITILTDENYFSARWNKVKIED